MDDFAERLPAIVLQFFAEGVRQFDQPPGDGLLSSPRGEPRLLILENGRGAPGNAGVEDDDVPLQILQGFAPADAN